MPLKCSSILFTDNFNTSKDFTIGFNYNISLPSATDGFAVFFVNGDIPLPRGGGPGAGLGVVSGTNFTSTSAISGAFLTVGFDILGNFCLKNSIPPFTTGLNSGYPNITIRKDTIFSFLSAINVSTTTALSANINNTVRVDVRNCFQTVNVSLLSGGGYSQIASFDTQIPLGTTPPSGKVGVAYSGEADFNIRDVTFNYSGF